VDENFNYIPDKITIELARQLNTNLKQFLVGSIETENIEHETEKEISQINNNSILITCVIIDHIDGNIKKCGSTNKLRRLWQLVWTWELDTDTVIQAKKAT
ncbi:2416_t:CDS:2, partial [Funneliformis geosporum]